MNDTKITIAVVCGGTGGHVYPAFSIGEAVRRHGGDVVFLISGKRAEEHESAAKTLGFKTVRVPYFEAPKLDSGLLMFPFRAFSSVRKCASVLKMSGADRLLAMGSYAGGAACAAAVVSGVPLFLHEGNSIPGKANRIFSRFAKLLMLSLPTDPGRKLSCKSREFGLPLRRELLDSADVPEKSREELREDLNLSADFFTILVFGGSQGASFFNERIPQVMRILSAKHPIQVIHLTGAGENGGIVKAYADGGIQYSFIAESEGQMQNLYHAADLVVCRAGAASTSELALFGKPALLIPYPFAADNHQRVNATTLAERNAILFVDQNSATVETLAQKLEELILSEPLRKSLSENIKRLAKPYAAEDIAAVLLGNGDEL